MRASTSGRPTVGEADHDVVEPDLGQDGHAVPLALAVVGAVVAEGLEGQGRERRRRTAWSPAGRRRRAAMSASQASTRGMRAFSELTFQVAKRTRANLAPGPSARRGAGLAGSGRAAAAVPLWPRRCAGRRPVAPEPLPGSRNSVAPPAYACSYGAGGVGGGLGRGVRGAERCARPARVHRRRSTRLRRLAGLGHPLAGAVGCLADRAVTRPRHRDRADRVSPS